MPKVPYSYEVNDKLVTGNGSLIPTCSLSNCFLLPSLTVLDSKRISKHPNEIFEFSFICTTYICFKKLLWLIHGFFEQKQVLLFIHKAANFEL